MCLSELCDLNKKRFALMVLAGFAFTFIYNFVVHDMLLGDAYLETPQLWRSMEEIQANCWLALIFQFVTTLVLGFIFTRHYEDKGLGEGVRFGMYLGIFGGLGAGMSYIYMPVSLFMGVAWFVTGVAHVLGLGLIFAAIYKK